MNKHTVVGAVLALAMLLIGGCGCVTAKPAPLPPAPAPEAAPAPEPELVPIVPEKQTCTTCLSVCFPTEDGLLVCEEECQDGHPCPMHEAKEKADAMRKLFQPPASPKPPHQNQLDDENDEGGRLYEL